MRLMDAVHENRAQSRWFELLPKAPAQVGGVHESDAELVPLGDGRLLALKVDTVVEEVLTGLYRDPFTAGRTAVVSTLSDLAAVGAEPLGVLMSVTLPEGREEEVQARVALGIRAACDEARVGVLGGDTSAGPALALSCVGAGVLPAATRFTRVGARPGHHVFGSGPFGAGGALAATVLLGLPGGFSEEDYRPPVRLAQGVALRGVASACMDTSDGLAATLDQLARVNGCALRVTQALDALLDPKVDEVRRAMGLPRFPLLASHHGEFELVFTVPDERLDDLARGAASIGWRPVPIGRVEEGDGIYFGDVAVDGARVRNLLRECRGDVGAYLRALLALKVEP